MIIEAIKEKSTLDAGKLTKSADSNTKSNPLNWIDEFILTESEINAIANLVKKVNYRVKREKLQGIITI